MMAQREGRGMPGRIHFPTQFSDIMAAQREGRGEPGRMHMGISAHGDLFGPPGAGLREQVPPSA
ncbi:hypothetical protein AGMMS49940_03020 [Spirochaetia bacterium]|nr:hypothetical protein AGMMS49940_03020 [Spirochaetia bacterium]